jgi:hypothetical protein
MIPDVTLMPAINIARTKSRTDRVDTARAGMLGVIQDWMVNSPQFGANRVADGLRPIDTAVNMLRQNWVGQGRAGPANEGAATAILNACSAWLVGRKLGSMRVTAWREKAIQELYWRVAWAYTCDHYAGRALAQISVNTPAGQPTTMIAPMPAGTPGGNPFQFGNSGYAHHPVSAITVLYRGDTRSPTTIQAAGGFLPRNGAVRANYQPFFDGSNTGDTPGFTIDPALAIDAGPAALATGNARDASIDAWVAQVGNGASRAFVYELGNLPPGTMCTRAEEQHVGREVIFLAIPDAMITRWWIVHGDRSTSGPFAFPAPNMPAAAAAQQSVPRQLA